MWRIFASHVLLLKTWKKSYPYFKHIVFTRVLRIFRALGLALQRNFNLNFSLKLVIPRIPFGVIPAIFSETRTQSRIFQ
jgi:hypothetical protein